jgi:single-strand DNA-binding protein
MAQDTNVVVLVGRLTRDAESKTLPSGAEVLDMRVAFTSRVKRGEAWEDESGYVNVSHFARSDRLAGWLVKGKQVAITGRLRFREWEAGDGSKRSVVEVLANDIQLLGGKDAAPAGGGDLPGDWGTLPSEPVTDDSVPF